MFGLFYVNVKGFRAFCLQGPLFSSVCSFLRHVELDMCVMGRDQCQYFEMCFHILMNEKREEFLIEMSYIIFC